MRSSCNRALASGSEGSIQSLARGKPDANTLLCDRVHVKRERKPSLSGHLHVALVQERTGNRLYIAYVREHLATKIYSWEVSPIRRHHARSHRRASLNLLHRFSKRCSLLYRNLLLWSMHVPFANWLITAEISDVVWTLNTPVSSPRTSARESTSGSKKTFP